MKVIDLLNKMATEKIDGSVQCFSKQYGFTLKRIFDLLADYEDGITLNDEVEVAEIQNKIITEIADHCKKGMLQYEHNKNLPEASYHMGYHDMGGEILEIIEKEKGE